MNKQRTRYRPNTIIRSSIQAGIIDSIQPQQSGNFPSRTSLLTFQSMATPSTHTSENHQSNTSITSKTIPQTDLPNFFIIIIQSNNICPALLPQMHNNHTVCKQENTNKPQSNRHMEQNPRTSSPSIYEKRGSEK